jgi:hypothetical protein
MAIGNISFVQEPVNAASKVPVITNWTPVIGYMLYQDDITALYYFKLIMEIRLTDASGTLLGKVKQRRNGYAADVTNAEARAFFDLKDVLNSYLVDTVYDQNDASAPFKTIHKLGANTATKIYSKNGDQISGKTQVATIYVKGYQEYSDSGTASPTEETSPSVNDTLYYMKAALPLMTARSTDTAYVQSNAFTTFSNDNADSRFLSDLKTDATIPGNLKYSTNIGADLWSYVQDEDYYTIAFLNDTTNFDSEITKIKIQLRSDDGSILATASFTVNSTNGGEAPGSVSSDSERLLYFGCGPANLEAQSIATAVRPSAQPTWKYIGIYPQKADSSLAARGIHLVRQDASCKGFKIRRLAWLNSVGGYDYFNFTKKSTQTIQVKRDNYETLLGNYNQNVFTYTNTERGKRTRKVDSVLKEVLQTDWIPEGHAELIESLIQSSRVDMLENSDTEFTQSVIVTDSSFVRKTTANDGLKIQYTINIEYANPLNTNI